MKKTLTLIQNVIVLAFLIVMLSELEKAIPLKFFDLGSLILGAFVIVAILMFIKEL